MTTSRAATVSETEFLALPESVLKTEFLDGAVVLSPAPTYWHQELVLRIATALREWGRRHAGETSIGVAPVDIRFGPGRILQPDVFVYLERIPRDARGPLESVPALVVEVLSPDRVYDRVTKRLVYAAAGVREYWVVDPAGRVERFTGAGLAEVETVHATHTSPLLPGFELALDVLFAE